MYTTETVSERLEDKLPPTSSQPSADPTPKEPIWTVGDFPDQFAALKLHEILRVGSEHEEGDSSALPKEEETSPKSLYILCPPKGTLNAVITNGAILLMFWCATWSFSGREVLPGGSLFGLFAVFYCAILGGKLLEVIKIPSVPQLPPLIGMLLAGFTLRNIPFVSKYIYIKSTWSSNLRNTALSIILLRAGLGLNPEALKNLKTVCLRLSLGPCLIETCAAAVFSHLIMKLPWHWAFLLGFVVAAVSPAVVVPAMLVLQERGYGIHKGIPTLLIAASSLDDIVAITGFNVCMSMVFAKESVPHTLLVSLSEVFVGLVLGAVLGCFLRYFPSADQTKHPWKRALLVLLAGVSAVIGGHRIGLHGAGGLCTLVFTFVAGIYWSIEKIRVQKIVAGAWNLFQPLLFGLVGSEVAVSSLKPNAVGICVATLSLALLTRIFATFLLMCFAGFNLKEKIFIALSWMPKATVQAVLGPLALESARSSSHLLEENAMSVMTLAFLAILISAPNGALLIGILGPKMLARSDPVHYKKSVATVLIHH